jgi:hypothetical protein
MTNFFYVVGPRTKFDFCLFMAIADAIMQEIPIDPSMTAIGDVFQRGTLI